MAVNSTTSNYSEDYSGEQCLVNFDLKVFRNGKGDKPYVGVGIRRKFYECLCLHFCPVGSLSWLADAPDEVYIHNFFKSFEKTSLS